MQELLTVLSKFRIFSFIFILAFLFFPCLFGLGQTKLQQPFLIYKYGQITVENGHMLLAKTLTVT